MDDWNFILGLLIFVIFISTVGAMAGQSIIKNIPNPPKAPGQPPPLDIMRIGDWASYIWDNISYFFSLMSISTDFALFSIIITALVIVLIWIVVMKILEIAAEFIPG